MDPGRFRYLNRSAILIVALASLGIVSRTSSAYVTVYGGPTYTPGVGGYTSYAYGSYPIGDGFASFTANKYSATGANLGTRAVRMTTDGAPAMELGTLGTSSTGVTSCYAYGGNAGAFTVGRAQQYGATGTNMGFRAVRWAPDRTAAQLEDLVPAATGSLLQASSANAIDGAGNVVGYSAKLGVGGADLGYRAVRWDAGGTAVTELEPLSTRPDGYAYATARVINAAGTIIGVSDRYDASGVELGTRAARWASASAMPTELPSPWTSDTGHVSSSAISINGSGVTVGWAYKETGPAWGYRGVRWSADGSTATELGYLNTSNTGETWCIPRMVNEAGVTVGYAGDYTPTPGGGPSTRAVRWSADSATPVVLQHPESPGFDTLAYAINSSGTSVGYYQNFTPGSGGTIARAFAWDDSGAWTDLNTLIDPASGWVILKYAFAISDSNWVSGVGNFDPDGPGPRGAYERTFLLQVPEPAVLGAAICIAGTISLTRRARRRAVGRV